MYKIYISLSKIYIIFKKLKNMFLGLKLREGEKRLNFKLPFLHEYNIFQNFILVCIYNVKNISF